MTLSSAEIIRSFPLRVILSTRTLVSAPFPNIEALKPRLVVSQHPKHVVPTSKHDVRTTKLRTLALSVIYKRHCRKVRWSKHGRKMPSYVCVCVCGVEQALSSLRSHHRYLFQSSTSFIVSWCYNKWYSNTRLDSKPIIPNSELNYFYTIFFSNN